MQNPLVSIIITVFNREKYLPTAIESVLAQTLADFELIIVDDLSTDRSVEIARGYECIDPRIKVFINNQNLGDYPNRNHAASLARGRYIKYVDSDDAILPHCLEIMIQMMERHPQAGMLLWSTEGESCYPFMLSPIEVYRRAFFEGKRMERAPLSLCIRREVFAALGGFDTRCRLGADGEFCYRVARYYPLLYGPHGLVFYRVHSGQIVSTTNDSAYRHHSELFLIVFAALRHPDCPLPPNEMAWHLARMIYGALRNGFQLAIRQGRWRAAWTFLRSLNITFAEMLPALSKRPRPPQITPPVALDWDDFPPPGQFDPSAPPLVSVIVAPGRTIDGLHLCLESLRRQRLAQIEVLVVLDDGQQAGAERVSAEEDGRFRRVPVSTGLATPERFNQGAKLAAGTYVKFIGPDCPMLYPYALDIETSILEKWPAYPFVSAGGAAFTLGGFALTPQEALALDAGTGGGCLRVDPSCVLFRRTVLDGDCFEARWDSWALVALLYLLAGMAGAILGPYGLSTAWRREGALPPGELPADLERSAMEAFLASQTDRVQVDWRELVAEGRRLTETITERCQWDDRSWVLSGPSPKGAPWPI